MKVGIAKIAGIKMIAFNKNIKKYICLIGNVIYLVQMDYDTKNSHFLPALIKKIYAASKKK